MARTVDPVRHEARRLGIIDAALTCFARHGYDGTTTAAICREARIGSGTFFHYFPTKLSLMVAVLELGTAESVAWFEAQSGRTDATRVLDEYAVRAAEDASDPRTAGFVRAVGAVMTRPEIAAALDRDARALRDGLLPWVRLAQQAGAIRTDLPADRLVTWLQALLDGYLGVVAAETSFDPVLEQETLRDALQRLLRP
ncbi:TetR/AcrR family transcriptional regulator [Rhodococcus pyridinivorans]|uniref:Putative TetR family transcriptional regulator n=1 Tax=Rhodococcus pyridinivorans AK37 TaxID=1114960 RepID=H0JLF2_9NOCA|nr:TetR/AcrR family transcriptional regulator [Rhodococcus pyridinivorans]EHK85881.1 putative TetR family transcriptional regulator [Rhodococcus pyridinivorans AK37]MCD2143462.1 TetR/AcrR family transcriptional regulator [Rhodococcus pyridinivorans]